MGIYVVRTQRVQMDDARYDVAAVFSLRSGSGVVGAEARPEVCRILPTE